MHSRGSNLRHLSVPYIVFFVIVTAIKRFQIILSFIISNYDYLVFNIQYCNIGWFIHHPLKKRRVKASVSPHQTVAKKTWVPNSAV